MTIYEYLKRTNEYSEDLQKVIERTSDKLMKESTSHQRPGMLLGKIQSGKTRAFIGVIGRSFDQGMDVAIIFTKASNALAKQTYERLSKEYAHLIERDQVRVFDIMRMPPNLRNYDLSKKLIFIVKKETKNMDRIQEAMFTTYPSLSERNVLFVDDEADLASVSYERDERKNVTDVRVISLKIDQLRKKCPVSAYLQVTATPYSLYLQPDERKIHDHKVFAPVRPAFTELVPTFKQYVGGETFFESEHADRYFQEIQEAELTTLKKQDLRRVKKETLLTSRNVAGLRQAFLHFLVGATIRRIQQKNKGEKPQKYAFMMHTERGKAAHVWQATIVQHIENQLHKLIDEEPRKWQELVQASFENVKETLIGDIPSLQTVITDVQKALQDEYVLTSVVNSEQDVSLLLDHTGQLRLSSPMNIFIGGQILDRGVTINQLIGFYYGRNPNRYQQDTVLQHSRLYGARDPEDVSVTRFYTSRNIYEMMKRVHEFDQALRVSIESGGDDQQVIFIQKDDENKIIPCSPNKLLLSDLNVIKPHKRFLPVGFQTGYKTHLKKSIDWLDQQLVHVQQPERLPINIVEKLIDEIGHTIHMQPGFSWDPDEQKALLRHMSTGHVWVIVRKNRNIRRFDSEGNVEDAPDTPSGHNSELGTAKRLAQTEPAIILLRQNGEKQHGWMGTPFWWPIIVAPLNSQTAVFAKKTKESERP
ncbi:serine phosphatase RsbU, regulator of sigma subunit [Geomicrobium sp. JCM 19037]|uniref:Z1 domain-containing protein n=1 Tax=Geomicrobium sp. JCM 19037 TaxID=1460634 RepID=UPI00045F24A2|nr:Z1 domain-containing protein [Geomicrobium sp. JCM 19037]GAK03739.1 serine phosphatase RsbU, regulator of sigma subunit [Geomicrobium sp. JCM 19037]